MSVTSKSQSTLAPAPVPDNRQPADLVARAAELKAAYRATVAQINAESIRNRADKAAKRLAREAADDEAFTERTYKLLWAAKEGPRAARRASILDEALGNFKRDSIPTRYSLQAIRDRNDAETLAKAGFAGVNPDPDSDAPAV